MVDLGVALWVERRLQRHGIAIVACECRFADGLYLLVRAPGVAPGGGGFRTADRRRVSRARSRATYEHSQLAASDGGVRVPRDGLDDQVVRVASETDDGSVEDVAHTNMGAATDDERCEDLKSTRVPDAARLPSTPIGRRPSEVEASGNRASSAPRDTIPALHSANSANCVTKPLELEAPSSAPSIKIRPHRPCKAPRHRWRGPPRLAVQHVPDDHAGDAHVEPHRP